MKKKTFRDVRGELNNLLTFLPQRTCVYISDKVNSHIDIDAVVIFQGLVKVYEEWYAEEPERIDEMIADIKSMRKRLENKNEKAHIEINKN
jgi:hypothetical protein